MERIGFYFLADKTVGKKRKTYVFMFMEKENFLNSPSYFHFSDITYKILLGNIFFFQYRENFFKRFKFKKTAKEALKNNRDFFSNLKNLSSS